MVKLTLYLMKEILDIIIHIIKLISVIVLKKLIPLVSDYRSFNFLIYPQIQIILIFESRYSYSQSKADTLSAFTGWLVSETTRLHLDTVATCRSTCQSPFFQQANDFHIRPRRKLILFRFLVLIVDLDFQTPPTGKWRKTRRDRCLPGENCRGWNIGKNL